MRGFPGILSQQPTSHSPPISRSLPSGLLASLSRAECRIQLTAIEWLRKEDQQGQPKSPRWIAGLGKRRPTYLPVLAQSKQTVS